MNKKYFGFAIADSMFPGDVKISKHVLTPEEAKVLVKEAIPCLNPSHSATIEAARARYGIEVSIPQQPPQVQLSQGDSIIVMGVRGLPRLTDRHEYTPEEIEKATFSFSVYSVVGDKIAEYDGQVTDTNWLELRTHSCILFTGPSGKFTRIVPNKSLEHIQAHWEGARVRDTISRFGAIQFSELTLLPPTAKDTGRPRIKGSDFDALDRPDAK